MDDILWSMTQQSRVLQELRKEIRGVWDDDAARELTSRYLDPHEGEDQQMLTGLNQQSEAITQSEAKLLSAEGHARQAEDHAAVVAESLKAAGQDVDSAYGNYDIYAQYNSEARSKFPIIRNLINQANNVCNA